VTKQNDLNLNDVESSEDELTFEEKQELVYREIYSQIPEDMPVKDQIIFLTSNITEYLSRNGISPCCIDKVSEENNPFPSKQIQSKFSELFNKYLDSEGCEEPAPEIAAFHYISMLKFEMLCNECLKKEIPDHIAEKVFSTIFD
jgi:hypothetical protein